MSDKKPWEKFTNTQPQDTEQKPWESFSGQTKPKEAERKALSDIGNSIASGAAAAGRGILGLSDLVTGSNSIQNTKNLGLDIKSSEQAWKDNLSEKAKQEEQAWNNTQGFVDTLKYGATHPFAVANKVAESLPAMAVSGGMGGAVTKGVIGGAIGEGMQQAGSSYADAIEKNNGNTPTDKDAGAALGSGITTGTISALSGGLAKKLGISDIDTAIANRVAGEAATSARPLGLGAYAKNIGKGFITEGALEELPQSATEQMWQNYADGNPIMEGVPEAAAQGLITGGLMGGAFNAANLPTFDKSQNDQGDQGDQGQSSGPMPEVLPPDGSNGLPNNAQPNTFDGSYRDLTPSNAPQLTNEQQPESGSVPSNNAPSSETPSPSGLGLNLSQLNNTTSEIPEVQAGNLSPSQELGIDPNQGGLSSAAAVAVDTGASPITAELQRQATQKQGDDQANWLNSIANPTDQNQNEAPQLGYSPSENTDTPPAQQAQVADLWNSQEPQQRMAILGGIYGNEDMARQNALASFDRLPKPAQQQIADIAVQNGAVSEDSNTQSSNGQAIQTAPQAPLATLAQDIAPDSQANTAPAIEPILGKDGKNKWFATQNKADEFIQKKSLGDNYTIEQTSKMRYEIVPKAQPQAEQTAQPNPETSSKVDEQWLSNFTNQMLQDKQLSTQLSNPSNSDELTFSEFSRKFDESLAKNFANNTDNANEQGLLQNKNDNEVAKQQAYQLAKSQINQNQQQPTQDYESDITESIEQIKQDKGIFGTEWYKHPQLNAKAKAAIEETLDKNLPSNIGKEEFQQRVESELNSIKINAMTQDIMPNIDTMPTSEILKTRKEVETQANNKQADIDYALQNHGEIGVGQNWHSELADSKRQIEVIDNELTKRGEQPSAISPQPTTNNAMLDAAKQSGQLEIIGLNDKAETQNTSGYSPVEKRVPEGKRNAGALDIYGDWHGSLRDDYTLTPRQETLIKATQQAIDEGNFYNKDVNKRVAEILNVPQGVLEQNTNNVEDGGFGNDVYYARQYIEKKQAIAVNNQAKENLGLKQGDKIGTVVTNSGKTLKNVVVQEVHDGGITVHASSGNKRQQYTVGYDDINTSIERAVKEGKRQPFVKTSANAEQAAEVATQNNNIQPATDTAGPSTNQADNAVEQRPNQSQGDGASARSDEWWEQAKAIGREKLKESRAKQLDKLQSELANEAKQKTRDEFVNGYMDLAKELNAYRETLKQNQFNERSSEINRTIDVFGIAIKRDKSITGETAIEKALGDFWDEHNATSISKNEVAKPINTKDAIEKIKAEKKAAKNPIAENPQQADNKDTAPQQEQDNVTDTRTANEPLSGVLAGTAPESMGANEPSTADRLPTKNSSRSAKDDGSLYGPELDNTDNGTITGDGRYQDDISGGVETKTAEEAIASSVEQANEPIANFTLTTKMGIGKGSMREKLAINLDIMDLLQRLETENRKPTVEEKTLMAQYTGFGGLSDAFPNSNGEYKKGWEELGNRLKNTLTPEQYKTARASTTSAFFTPPSVIQSMWDIAERLGYNGGMVLEPSIGIGSFIGFAPKKPQGFIGSEIDGTTFAIAKHLYPQANLFNKGYETLPVADNSIDLAIGNPPYGSVKLNFVNKPHLNGKTIANQFMLSTLEQVKPNGLSIMVVSSNFMDSTNTANREEMAKLGNLEYAIRLPNSTFDDAGTAVVADILVFRKHDQATLDAITQDGLSSMPSWVKSSRISLDGVNEVNFNPFFNDKLAGELQAASGEGGRAIYTIKAKNSIDKALKDFVKSIEKVKPTKTAKQIEKEINTTNQSMIDSLVLEAEGNSIGDIRRNENGRITQVIERTDGTTNQLVERELLPSSVWSDSYTQDLDGRWYRIEDVKDKKGKSVKVLDKDGKPTKANLKQKVYFTDDKVPAQSKLGIQGYNILNNTLNLLNRLEHQLSLEQDPNALGVEANRKELAKEYNTFVKTFGYLNNPRNAKFIKQLPKANLVFALEKSYTPEKSTGSGKNKNITQKEVAKASDILVKRMIMPKSRTNHAGTAKEALTLSLAYRGNVDLSLMAELTDKTPQAIVSELNEIESPVIFNNPATNEWETADEYLSGNIREKIKEAEQRGLTKNLQALEAVLPTDVPVENIAMRLGMNWIPAEVYTDFAKHLLGSSSALVRYEPVTNTYSVTGSSTQARHDEFMGGGKSPEWLLERILNNRKIEVKQTDYRTKKTVLLVAETEEANEKAQAIKAEFESWLYNNGDTVAKLAELFNKVHNAIVERKFDGSHLELSGKVPDDIIKLRTHQNNAVWRGITTNAVLYDHAVGSGKTFTGIARAMERKHLGLSKKPVLVVPNHMVNQFAQDIYKLYPAANILTAGKKDFEKKNRKKLFGKIATNDYDIIVLPHSSFEFIKLSKETQKRYLEEEKARIESAIIMAKAESGSRDMTTKQLETLRANLETKIKRLTETKRNDDEIGFEQMGIDDITVDEAHEFKNLFFTTKMQGVKGLGTPTGSNKAMDLWLKTKYIHETGGALAFMTGTPISNSAAEMHAMMRYLMPKILEDNKVVNFDAWANTYAENKAKFEATESGRLKLTTRFAREWQNMGSLMAMWRTVTDSVTNEDIKATYRAENNGAEFPLPRVAGGNRQPVSVKPTASQEHMLELILAGFKMVEHGGLDKEEKAVLRLKLMDLATKNALDPRIIDPTLEAGGKLQAVADNTFEIYQKWNDDKGTQIIFLDRSMPKSKSDAKVIAEYDAVIAERDKAIANNDDDALLKANDKLEKFDENEMAELKSAQNGGFNAYDEIKRLLITKGVPANEIAFIQEANTDEEKKAIFDKVNSGEIRIILGSTPRMGAGTNIQQRLVALHHVDAPWKPSDIEQREGRIIRQGNELYAKYGHDNFEVEIKPYITEKTADAKRWDTMSAKLGTINAIRNYKGEHTLDFEEDDGDASFQEIAALATGNPMMLERMELTEVRSRLNRALTTYRKREAGDLGRLKSAQQSVERLPKKIEVAKSIAKDYETASAIAKTEYDKQSITIDGKVFNSRKSANAYAKEKAELAKKADTKATYVINGENIGSYTAADTKIKELIGNKPDIPMLLEVSGKQYSNPSDMLTDNLMNKVNSHPVQPVFKLMGFDVTSYDDGGMTLMVVERDEQVLAQRSLDKQATAIKIINVINDLAKQLDSRAPLLEANLKSALKTNQQTIELLQDKVGKPFPDQEQLDSVSERLTELQSILGEADKPEITDIDKMYFNELNGLLDGIASRRSSAKPAENTQPDADATGDAQYSQQGSAAGTTKQKVLNTLYKRFGKATIDKLIADGNLEIIDYAEAKRRNPKTPSRADGYYADGKAVLIADNLSPDMIIPTFLHELGGHGGLQTLMSDGAYQSLLKEFDRMVAEGNPLAIEAKSFADATSPNAKVAQDEYLPYLISLAAKAQGNSKVKSMLNRIVMAFKSFIRDKFGVSLKVTPADIVALSEKMVNERAKQSNATANMPAQFSKQTPQTEIDQVRKQYEGTDQWMKAPNGKPTNLTEQQWLQVRTPSFKAWFGDWENDIRNASEIIDRNDEPLVVRHFTNKGFTVFDNTKADGFWFTDKKELDAEVGASGIGDTIEVFLNIRNSTLNGDNYYVQEYLEENDADGIENRYEGFTDYAVTNPNQIKSATDNIGTFNPENDDIRYSQMGGNSPQVNKLSKALSEFLKNPLSFIKAASDNKVTDNLGKALALLGRRQLVDIYKKDLPPLKEYSDTVEQMDADANERAYEADKLVKEWGKLKDELPLAELMHDATLKGIDPAEAYQTGDDRAIYQQLRRRYDALSPDAKRIYKQARDDYKAQQRSVFNAIKGRIQRTDMSAPRQAELIRKMEQGFFFGQKVYFPLARFGNYVVAVKDAAGDIISVSRAETKGQADELRKELIAQYPNDKVGRVMLDKEFVSSRDGVTRGFMSDLFDAVDKLNISSQERAEFEDTLGQLYLNSLPDISFAKSGMHRKGTPGFSQNARRAYAQHMSRGSHYVAKMRHADVLQAKLDEMQDYVKAQGEADPNYDQPKMQRVVDEMEKRHESLMNNHTAGWSSLATSVGFMWYMGLSPASALVNLSQTALVAYPVMGAKWGFAKASKELLIASEQAAKSLNDLQSSLSGDEKTAFDEAVKRGVIDMTQAHDLAGVARGEDDSVMWKIRKPMEWASFMFHHAEKFNRQVTFIASYRLAKQAGANHKQAIEQAIDATYEGHFSYASSNRPRMMQGDWARVFLLFKQYGQNMVYTLSRNAYLSAKGDKQAMKTLAGMLALHGTFAGILGLPLATTLLGFASALGGDDDEPWNAEIALRNYLAELLGDGAGEVVAKGLPRALGIDLSSRVGLDSLILPRMQEGLEGQRAGESFTAAMTGPVAGIGVNALAGFSDIQKAVTPNEYLIGTEKLLPKAFRDLMKTYRLAAYGNVDKTGVEIVPQENISLSDVGQQALGFRSGKIAQAQEGKSAIYKMDKEIGSKRQRLMNRYAKAYMAGDVVAADEAWQDIKRFNAGIGKDYPKLKITKPKLMQSIKQRRRRIDDAEDGIYLPSSREASRQYGSFATE